MELPTTRKYAHPVIKPTERQSPAAFEIDFGKTNLAGRGVLMAKFFTSYIRALCRQQNEQKTSHSQHKQAHYEVEIGGEKKEESRQQAEKNRQENFYDQHGVHKSSVGILEGIELAVC